MNRFAAALLGIAFAAPASAAEGERLDLSVPEGRIDFADGAASSYANDPPGAYYGDTSGRPASQAVSDAGCDSSEPQISGSVSTGIGYSKRLGNSHWSATNLNIGRCSEEDEGKNSLSLSINVFQGDGPGWYGDRHHPHAPYYPARTMDMPPPRR